MTSVTRSATRVTLLAMAGPDTEVRREISGALFNNRHFGDVVAHVGRLGSQSPEGVTTRMLASATGLPDSVVRPVLQRLEAAGVLESLPRSGGIRGQQFYRPVASPLWERLKELVLSVESEHGLARPGGTPA